MDEEQSNDESNERRDRMTRREFARDVATMGVAGLAAPVWVEALATERPAPLSGASGQAPLEIAEYSQFFVGVEGVAVPRGTLANGSQMSVEYQIPARVRHPYPVVLVHGEGGQGSDWISTPDGRTGWVSYLLQEGYKVYTVDRPGQGRGPFEPQFHGAFTHAMTYEQLSDRYTINAAASSESNPFAHLHTQWPGGGRLGDPTLDQLLAAQGQAFAGTAAAEAVWRSRGAMLLDEIGPAILITHGDSGAFGWVVADERPALVRAIVALEPSGPAFQGRLAWGVTAGPLAYEPEARASTDLSRARQSGVGAAYELQAAPARQLKNLAHVPIAVVTAEASEANLSDAGTVAFLNQAGCTADHVRLADRGVHGNGHFMMMETNNREVLRVLLDWLDRRTGNSVAQRAAT